MGVEGVLDSFLTFGYSDYSSDITKVLLLIGGISTQMNKFVKLNCLPFPFRITAPTLGLYLSLPRLNAMPFRGIFTQT